jgi:hypothetical protein
MKQTLQILAVVLMASAAFTTYAFAPGVTVGLISKVIAEVQRKPSDKDWVKAAKGDPLVDGDRVKTGEKSMAIIKFMDNSLVRIRELSEVTVSGSMTGPSFSKSVDVRSGVVGFTVQKQRPGEEFRFTSPTSVASIRGTGGAFCSSNTGDTLIVLEGTIGFANKKTNQSITVPSGFTGFSMPGGSLASHQSTSQEIQRALNALRGDASKTLEFELRDNQGRQKRLHLEYRD